MSLFIIDPSGSVGDLIVIVLVRTLSFKVGDEGLNLPQILSLRSTQYASAWWEILNYYLLKLFVCVERWVLSLSQLHLAEWYRQSWKKVVG